jgi:hypothetical protein
MLVLKFECFEVSEGEALVSLIEPLDPGGGGKGANPLCGELFPIRLYPGERLKGGGVELGFGA